METQYKDLSCWSSRELIVYAHEKGISSGIIFAGIEEHRETLENPLEWVDGYTWTKLASNIEKAFGGKPGVLFDIGQEVMLKKATPFQLLFFRVSPMPLIVKKIGEIFKKSINNNFDVRLDYDKKGEINIYFRPIDRSRSSPQMCDYKRGCISVVAKMKGFGNARLTELSCAARTDAAECVYNIRWTPSPNILQSALDFFLVRFRDPFAIIKLMEENQRKLQDQYNEISTVYNKLKNSEAKFRAIFENIQDVYFEMTPDGTLTELSPSIHSISHFTGEELLNTRLDDICVQKNAAAEIVRKLEQEGRISDHEIQIRDKNGSLLSCSITAGLIRVDNFKKVTGVLRDSTARKKSEQEKIQLLERLRQAEKLQAIGQLAGGIAHDFKNQFFGISANAQLIKKHCGDNPTIRKCVENIIKSSTRSSGLTKQLLAFARKGKYQNVGVELHAMIQWIADILETSADKKIFVKTELKAGTTTVLGDPGQIENALLNLAFNAREAMPQGGTLTFITENVAFDQDYCAKSEYDIKPGAYIRIAVRDTGVGIEKSLVNRIFEPFFTTKEIGNGLGLSAVYGTVKEHKGAITVETAPGAGTTMSLYLPVSAVEPIAEEKEKPGIGLKRKLSLLLIDDEEIVRNGAKNNLEEAGFGVTAFGDGGSSLRYYKEHFREIDIILLDMILPDLGAEQIFAEIQAINPSARIILWSAFTMPETVKNLCDRGAIDFIDKDCNIADFAEKVALIAESL